jgi:hypothetical protein
MTEHDKSREALEALPGKWREGTDGKEHKSGYERGAEFAFCKAAKDLEAALAASAPSEPEAVRQLRHLVDDLVFADDTGMHHVKPSKAVLFCNMVAAAKRLLATPPQPSAQERQAAASRWCPDKCPITRKPLFMWIEHPEMGMVPTYGGPFDSYTIPEMGGETTAPFHERELTHERYDHDAGHWVEGGETIPLRVVHDEVLDAAQERAEVLPIELMGVAESLAQGGGFWASCSGCHELNEGCSTGAYSNVFRCALGNGCSECGGLGAVWDDTDYDAMAEAMAGDVAPERAEVRGLTEAELVAISDKVHLTYGGGCMALMEATNISHMLVLFARAIDEARGITPPADAATGESNA